ncbi:MAG TPA: ketopantoate reductase family protein [Jatrophihabitantaceae bacterium]|jgi:2-dehydropantoate 2-reductase
MSRILVVGAGATGGFFGTRLAQHGRDVTFLVREARAAQLRRDGLRVTGLGADEVITPQVLTTAELDTTYDVVLLTVKATALDAAVGDLAPAVGPDTALVPFLNGLDHLRVLNDRFGVQTVLGGVVMVMTTLGADGSIVQLAPMASITIGAQREPTPQVRLAERLLAGAGFELDVSADIVSAMWHKWVFIASIGALTSLGGGAVGEIVAVPGGADLGPAILDEAAAVAKAAGHPLPDERYAFTRAMLTESGSANTSSLFRDRQGGRPTEAEHILGHLARRGRALGVDTPLLDLATLTLRVYEKRLAVAAGG